MYTCGRMLERIRSADFGHSIGRDIGLANLPLELAESGTELEVEVMGERTPAVVAAGPLMDHEGKRLLS